MGGCWQVITKKTKEGTQEPFEDAYVEVPEEHVGQVVDLLGSRKGLMMDMSVSNEGLSLVKYRIPTRCPSAWLQLLLLCPHTHLPLLQGVWTKASGAGATDACLHQAATHF